MSYYIGLEDLAANAFIELLKKKTNQDDEICISLSVLEEYGTAVANFMQKKKNEKVIMMLSRNLTTRVFNVYHEFFKEVTSQNGTLIALQKDKTQRDLIETFRGYLPIDLLVAFTDKETVDALAYFKAKESNIK